MSSISRKKLARGTKLYTDHVAGPLQSAATALSGNITPDQMESSKTTFRINLHVPYIDSSCWRNGDQKDNNFSIPFTLPPFQQNFDITAGVVRVTPNTYKYSTSAPRFYLDELSFGFDQRDESCVIADRFYNYTVGTNAVYDGQMNFPDIGKLDIRLAIVEHKMTYWDKNEDPANASKSTKENVGEEIWSVDISDLAYAGKDVRLNPLLVPNLDLEVSPHKTYVFTIHAPDLGQDDNSDNKANYALSSVQISMKIRTDLVSRDTVSGDGVQNMPTKHNGLPTREIVAITTPAAGSVITADAAGGISKNLATIDDVFRDKLRSGYTENAETVPNQNILLDSGYEVIAVPLMGNKRYQVLTNETVGFEPYFDASASAGSQYLADRRIIPIDSPFVLHHVVMAYNWQRPWDTNSLSIGSFFIPEDPTFTVDVGVAMATGIESDSYTYQQLAQATLTAPDWIPGGNKGGSWFTNCIDRVRCQTTTTRRAQANSTSTGTPKWWDWELHQIPLVGTGGAGYFAQGKPIFIGKGWSPTWARTNMTATGAPNTGGAEQFLEVRMRIRDTAEDLEDAPSPGAPAQRLYSGYQGHWVYLIGKKALL